MIDRPDMRLIAQWNDATSDMMPYAAPFVSRFSVENKRLHFVAARHEGDTNSPTLKTVQQEFDIFAPDVVIVEGMPNDGTLSPEDYYRFCKTQGEQDFVQGGESSFAVVSAFERGIPFVTGEPRDSDLRDGIMGRGYSDRDYEAFRLCCYLKPFVHQDGIDDAQLADIADDYIATTADSPIASYGHLAQWYREHMGHDLSADALRQAEIGPSMAAESNYLQKIMAASDAVREPHILNTIADLLQKHEKVLVVYGAAHLGKQKPVLENMMGASVDAKPF